MLAQDAKQNGRPTRQVVNIEATPNPAALKFVVMPPMGIRGARSFCDFEAAVGDPLASAIFSIGNVASVFYVDGFVAVSKTPDAVWTDLIDAVCEAIEDAQVASGRNDAECVPGTDADGIFQKILDVIEARIRPGLAGDGGGVEVVSFDGTTVKIAYQGACGSCPAAATSTLQFMEGVLQHEVGQQIKVAIV